ncbi:MAG: methylenetetrahydrofolate reductase C-terminal domain-containing protein [Bacillota bacterium]|nr:methylenetetrahydrofolate reductase C-terminal domain-containing protein [Bacillota bacterium]
MIVVEGKPFAEIARLVSPYRNLLLVGCGACATVCFAGGQTQAESLGLALRLQRRVSGGTLRTASVTVTRQCDPAFLAPLGEAVAQAEAVVSLGCGVGVQQLADEFPEAWVIPAMNTRFAAGLTADGTWEERCALCGECILYLTAGICPLARCAKGLLNGPCGGTREDGKCEADAGRPCAWLMIYERLAARGRLDLMAVCREPKDWQGGRMGGRGRDGE